MRARLARQRSPGPPDPEPKAARSNAGTARRFRRSSGRPKPPPAQRYTSLTALINFQGSPLKIACDSADCSGSAMFVDHYEVLQISPNADSETIRRVYRMQAQRFHPDNLDTGNAETFRRISDAYEVLIDPQRRSAYDRDHREARRRDAVGVQDVPPTTVPVM